MFGNSPPPSRKTRFGLSAKIPRAPPYVHFSWPGSVLRSCGHPSTTSYGPETSSAPMAAGTAEAAAPVPAPAASAAGGVDEDAGIIRPPSGMPAARPTTSANTAVAVLLMPPSARDYTATRSPDVHGHLHFVSGPRVGRLPPASTGM